MSKVTVSSQHGEIIRDRFTGSSGKVVIVIEENHANLNLQNHIVEIIEEQLNRYHLNLILLEGFTGSLDTSLLAAFPGQEVKKQIAASFLNRGKISAVEYLALVWDIQVIGVEDEDRYQKNVDLALDKTRQEKEDEIWEKLDELQTELEDVATQIDAQLQDFLIDLAETLNDDELEELVAKLEQLNEEKITFAEFFEYLQEKSDQHDMPFPAPFQRFLAIENEVEALLNQYDELQKPFFDAARTRDESIAFNSLAAMEAEEVQAAILVVGSWHTPNLMDIFEKPDISVSYVVISPFGLDDEIPDEQNKWYQENLQAVKTPFEKWFSDLKPRPRIARQSFRIEVEAVYKAFMLDQLVESGLSDEKIRADYAVLFTLGNVAIEDWFSMPDFRLFHFRVGDRPVIMTIDSREPTVPLDDLVYSAQVGNKRYQILRGTTAQVLVGRAQAIKYSDKKVTFIRPFAEDDRLAFQFDGERIVNRDLSIQEFYNLLDPERPDPQRNAKLDELLAGFGGAGQPPIVILTGNPLDGDPEGERRDRESARRLAVEMAKRDMDVLVAVDPALAKANLEKQEPMYVEGKPNFSVVVDKASLSPAQVAEGDSILSLAASEGAPTSDSLTEVLPGVFEKANIVLVTADNDAELAAKLDALGDKGLLRGKMLFLAVCANAGQRQMVDHLIREYGATEVIAYLHKVSIKAVRMAIEEAINIAREEQDISLRKALRAAIKSLATKIDVDVKPDLNRLQENWSQIARLELPDSVLVIRLG